MGLITINEKKPQLEMGLIINNENKAQLEMGLTTNNEKKDQLEMGLITNNEKGIVRDAVHSTRLLREFLIGFPGKCAEKASGFR